MTHHRQEPITTVIARSSLGAPAVRKLRARTTSEQRSVIVHKVSSRKRGIPGGR